MALYTPLDSLKDEFRLIRLVGNAHEPAYELASFSVHDDDISWVAVSYFWGTSEATKLVTVNGEKFAVRPNLHLFLVHMAIEDRRDWFFIDAICINQSDLAERTSQFSLMGQIYRKAEEVIAWVYVEHSFKIDGKGQLDWERDLKDLQQVKKTRAAIGKGMSSKDRRKLTECLKITRDFATFSNYWSRLWMVQEILLTRVVSIPWLSCTFDWSEIGAERENISVPALLMLRTAAVSRLARRAPGPVIGAINKVMCQLLNHWQKVVGADLNRGQLLDFHEAVQFVCTQDCSQLSDCIFGLLGIASSYIQPDYNTPLLELYTASLYNTLLSLWCQRPAESSNSAQELSSKFPHIGNALIYSFKFEPFQEIPFLISYEDVGRFMPRRQRPGLQALLFYRTRTLLSKFQRGTPGKFRFKKKWYETSGQALRRFSRDFDLRVDGSIACEEAAKSNDEILEGPSHCPQRMSCSAWVSLIHSICDEMWTRASADIQQTSGDEITNMTPLASHHAESRIPKLGI